MEIRKVLYEDLVLDVKIEKSTKDVNPKPIFFGQERVENAFNVGLKVKKEGYNIYVSGPEGIGKTIFTIEQLHEESSKYPVPDDILYYFDFKNPFRPKYLKVKSGLGKKLVALIDETLNLLKKEIYKIFESKEYEDEEANILREAEEKREEIFEKLKNEAAKYNLGVLITPRGIELLPVLNGRIITNLRVLTEKQFEEYQEKLDKFDNIFREYIRQLRELDHQVEEFLKNLKNRVSKFKIDSIYFKIEEAFKDYPEILSFIDYHKKNVIENIDIFIQLKYSEKNPFVQRTLEQEIQNFQLNIIVDNANTKGAPVIIQTNPTFKKLFGGITYQAEMGILYANHRNIFAGDFLKANGGFIVLYIKDLLKNYFLWESIKKVIVNKEVYINEDYTGGIFSIQVGLDPQPIPIDVKVILIGDEVTYDLLSEYDPDFKRIFKVKAEFNPVVKFDEDIKEKFPILIKNIITSEGLKDVSKEGLEELLKFSILTSGDKGKVNLVFNTITDIIREASILSQSSQIDVQDVKEVIKNRIFRENLIEEKILELIDEGKLIIDLEKRKVGQVNGLSVYEIGNLTFGKPTRITASAYIGEKGIINIEREVELSGPIHDKGVLILSGYLGRKYGTDFPLSLSCSITFEQSYGEVEGDSASLAELIAILSEIGEIPVRQDIGITGSIDQHGNVQPVGGIKEKIEGFFKVCKIKGLTGKQGVIVPLRNKNNILLDEEVIQAVKDSKFNIFLVENVDEAIYILSELDPLDFHRKVKFRLEEFYKNATKMLKK
ncbi:ATP-binding protein [Sulfurihydrogenibium sp.]|uniref:Lon protease family protein n=1 Tax=Sulfurihydrogenibium sp. TaxID=2053621 RepID=UPI002623230E|nr:ATP-binding protein [Sulfurihydrogenibium sp.]